MSSNSQPVIRQLFDRDSFSYTYLAYDPDSLLAALIDPVIEQFDRDIKLLEELGLELLYVFETHVHADHITSAGKLKQATGAAIAYSANAGVAGVDWLLQDGDQLPLGQFQIQVLATPGHTNGCLTYRLDDALFTGDCLLVRGCGRTDFQQGSAERLYQSINDKLYHLPDATRVFPAHDYRGHTSSTIGEEKRWNPRLQLGRTLQQFQEIMSNLNLAMPKKINEAVPANMHIGLESQRSPHREFTVADLHRRWQDLPANSLVIDNRTPEEFAEGHVPGSRNIPFGTEVDNIPMLGKYDRLYIYCRSGRRAQTATTTLAVNGLDRVDCVSHGGMPDWIAAGYPVEV